jgi:hypothetical protein
MHHARNHARHRAHREVDPVVRRIDAATLALGLACVWIYIGMLVVDGEHMARLLTWPFVGILLAIVAFRFVSHRVLRRRSRAARAKS